MSRYHYKTGLEKYPVYPNPTVFRECTPADSGYFLMVQDAGGANVLAPSGSGANTYMLQEFPYGFSPDVLELKFQLKVNSGEAIFLEQKHFNETGQYNMITLNNTGGSVFLTVYQQKPRETPEHYTILGPQIDFTWHDYCIRHSDSRTELWVDGISFGFVKTNFSTMSSVQSRNKSLITWWFKQANCFLAKPEFTAVCGENL